MALSAPSPIGSLRRALAPFIDFVVYFGVFAAVGIASATASSPTLLEQGLVPILIVFHVVVTALTGSSPGRFMTGIRVVQAADRPPGLWRSLVRSALVLSTGCIGVYIFAEATAHGRPPRRMWWDAAVGTSLVRVQN
jgi:uncharacterized RDD family membrane protein YckC